MTTIDPYMRAADLLLGARASVGDVGSRVGAVIRSNTHRNRLLHAAAFDIETAAMLLRSAGAPDHVTGAARTAARQAVELGAEHVNRRTGRRIAQELRASIDHATEALAEHGVDVRRLPKAQRDPVEARVAAVGDVDLSSAVRSAMRPTDEFDGTDLAKLVAHVRGADPQLAPLEAEHVVDLNRALGLTRIGVDLPEAWHLRSFLASVRAAHRFAHPKLTTPAQIELHSASLERLRSAVDALDEGLAATHLSDSVGKHLRPLLDAIDEFEPHVMFAAQTDVLGSTRGLVEHNLGRFEGHIRPNYGQYSDFAELGRIRESLRLVMAISDDQLARSAATVDSSAEDAARASDTIVW